MKSISARGDDRYASRAKSLRPKNTTKPRHRYSSETPLDERAQRPRDADAQLHLAKLIAWDGGRLEREVPAIVERLQLTIFQNVGFDLLKMARKGFNKAARRRSLRSAVLTMPWRQEVVGEVVWEAIERHADELEQDL